MPGPNAMSSYHMESELQAYFGLENSLWVVITYIWSLKCIYSANKTFGVNIFYSRWEFEDEVRLQDAVSREETKRKRQKQRETGMSECDYFLEECCCGAKELLIGRIKLVIRMRFPIRVCTKSTCLLSGSGFLLVLNWLLSVFPPECMEQWK